MLQRIINLGRFRPGATITHTESFDNFVLSATQTCNCISMQKVDNELTFTLLMPIIDPKVRTVYDEAFINEGIAMERKIRVKLLSSTTVELIINFTLYD